MNHFHLIKIPLLFTAMILLGVMDVGCKPSRVGDPCFPQSIPEDGFKFSETYIETSSVQCLTRVCIVNELEGNPSLVIGDTCDEPENPQCVTEEQIDHSIYCTCRCATPDNVSAPTCRCPSGFSCQEVFNQGGPGIRGSYCIKNDSTDDEAS